MSHPQNEAFRESWHEAKEEAKHKVSKRMKYEKARKEHKAGAPYKTAYDAIKSPTFSAMHKARKDLKK